MQIIEILDANVPLLQMKLIDMRCKHVLNIDWKEQLVLKYAKECGYEWCLWGSHDGHTGDVDYHKNHIFKMQQEGFVRPLRIVICSYPHSNEKYIWVDNLHSCIHYIRQYGLDVKLKQVPFYIIDISEYKDVVVSYNNSVIQNPVCVSKAIECAYYRRIMSNNKKLLEVNYMVSDFLNSNKEFYTYKNTRLCVNRSINSNESILSKAQAFNTLREN